MKFHADRICNMDKKSFPEQETCSKSISLVIAAGCAVQTEGRARG